MKKCLIITGILFAINVTVTVAFVFMMPDQVPVHFTGGEVDRIGSRYEYLTILAIAFVFGMFLMLLTKYGEQSNRKTMTRLNIGMQAIFIAMSVFVSANVLSYDASSVAVGMPDASTSKIATIVIGATLILLGNLMPKTTRNSTFGIRVPWTQKSDEAWQKSQRFGACVSIPTGILMIACGIFFDDHLAFVAPIGLFVVWALACLIGSYLLCKDLPD